MTAAALDGDDPARGTVPADDAGPAHDVACADDVVLVDDDPLVAEFLRRVLRRSTRRLRVFDDPLAALEHLSERTPEVLLVDARMPRMDGPELLARLAERDRPGGRRVFLSSAGPLAATEWLGRMPAHVEILAKDALLDRHTLLERLEQPRP